MKNFFKFKGKSFKAQVVVIITLVLAFIVLFSVVGINIAQVGEVKNMTAKAADTAALKIASNLGSMSKHYKEYVTEGCNVDWIKIGLLVAAMLAVVFVASFGLGGVIALVTFSIFLGGGFSVTAFKETITSSRAIQAEIYNRFAGMSKYNAIREEALYSTISSLQTDDQIVENIGGLKFRDPTPGGLTYDLSEVKEMDISKQPYVGRFFAWYFSKRLPLVDEAQLKSDAEAFIFSLDKHILFDAWDPVKWIYGKALLVSDGGLSSGKYVVTTSTAPSWVHSTNRIIEVGINETLIDVSSGRYTPTGFLNDVFDDLASELEIDWPGSMTCCSNPFNLGWLVTCDDIAAVSEGLTDFIAKYKFVKEMPESDRMGSITQWFTPQFYDIDINFVRDETAGSSHDVYDRLTRDAVMIQTWIDDLEDVDIIIRDEIDNGLNDKGYGACNTGQGSPVASTCDTSYSPWCTGTASDPACNSWYYCNEDPKGCCDPCCHNAKTCAFVGTYNTCCDGNTNAPVCTDGDLYNKVPSWCPPPKRVNCNSHCKSCNVNITTCSGDSENYQGIMAYNNKSGKTEVGQAIAVLKALIDDIGEIKTIIKDFAINLGTYVSTSDRLRNAIDYAWKGKDLRNHYVVTIIENYPEVLPHVVETREFYDLIRCLEFVGATNYDPANSIDDPFLIWAGRYDQDMPTGWWNLRYRRNTDLVEFDTNTLDAVVTETANNGMLSQGTTDSLANLYNKFMIYSITKGYYGPEKTDIRIERKL